MPGLSPVEEQRETRALRRRVGLCYDCPNDAFPGRVRCASCLAIAAAYARTVYARQHQHRYCYDCGERPVMQGQPQCAVCREVLRMRTEIERTGRLVLRKET